MKRIIGYLMLAAVNAAFFLGIFRVMVHNSSLEVAIKVFGVTGLLMMFIVCGALLATPDDDKFKK